MNLESSHLFSFFGHELVLILIPHVLLSSNEIFRLQGEEFIELTIVWNEQFDHHWSNLNAQNRAVARNQRSRERLVMNTVKLIEIECRMMIISTSLKNLYTLIARLFENTSPSTYEIPICCRNASTTTFLMLAMFKRSSLVNPLSMTLKYVDFSKNGNRRREKFLLR